MISLSEKFFNKDDENIFQSPQLHDDSMQIYDSVDYFLNDNISLNCVNDVRFSKPCMEKLATKINVI